MEDRTGATRSFIELSYRWLPPSASVQPRLRIRLCVSTRQRPQGAAPKPANHPVNSAQDARTCAVHCLCRLALDRPRIVDIKLDDLSGRGRRGHQSHALRGVKAVPSTLRVDSDRAGAEHERPGRPVIASDFEGRSTVENVDQLVAGEMGFPMTLP